MHRTKVRFSTKYSDNFLNDNHQNKMIHINKLSEKEYNNTLIVSEVIFIRNWN